MAKEKQLFYSLGFFILLILITILLYSCESTAVSAIESVTPSITVLPQFEGKVSDGETGLPIADVQVQLDGQTVTTNAEGIFSFETELTAGESQISVQKTGYLSVNKTVVIPEYGASVYREYKLALTAAPIQITSNGGGFTQSSDEGDIEIEVPASAVSADVNVSFTPALGSKSPVEINTMIASDEAPAQSLQLDPATVEFAEPIQLKLPSTFPAEYVTGEVKVMRVNPETNLPEEVGTAVLENGKYVFNAARGGQYFLKAKTNLRHEQQSVHEAVLVGEIGFNESPGTFRTFSFTEETSIDPDPGFSENLIESVFGFSDASRDITLGVVKNIGSTNAVTSYAAVDKTIHTYTTPSGEVIAKGITENNMGSSSSFRGGIRIEFSWDPVHGIRIVISIVWEFTGQPLTAAELALYGLTNL